MIPRPPTSTLFPYTTLFRSGASFAAAATSCALGPTVPTTGLPSTRASASRTKPTQYASAGAEARISRSEEHTSELQSPDHLVCRLLLEKKKQQQSYTTIVHD